MNTLPARLLKISAGLAALLCLASATVSAQWKVGDKLPDLKAFPVEGLVPLDIKGVVLMIDFWASWCAPCKASFPVLDQLQKEYGGRGFQIIAISVDEEPAAMRRFLADHPISFVTARDKDQKLVESSGIEAMPSSFLVDRSGVIRFAHRGFKPEETPAQLTTEVETLLKESKP